MGEWYYIGHYGQLGPLTRDQIDDLVQGGVIVHDTYVWRAGMAGWQRAEFTVELQDIFRRSQSTPPPPPIPQGTTPQGAWSQGSGSQGYSPQGVAPVNMAEIVSAPYGWTGHPLIVTTRSDKSRVLGGLLQFVPGIGRIYLGHVAIGVLQLVLTLCGGVGLIWSWIDGIYILAGGVKLDGYGRLLKE